MEVWITIVKLLTLLNPKNKQNIYYRYNKIVVVLNHCGLFGDLDSM